MALLTLGLGAFVVVALTRKNIYAGSALSLGQYVEPYDVVHSNTADARKFDEQYSPPDNVWTNAIALANNVINPAMSWLTTQSNIAFDLVVDSWYRAPRTNEAVGGEDDSDHLNGSAVDLKLFSGSTLRNELLVRAILASGASFDQLILENGTDSQPAWIHVSYDATKTYSQQRNEILRYNGSSYTEKSRSWAENLYL